MIRVTLAFITPILFYILFFSIFLYLLIFLLENLYYLFLNIFILKRNESLKNEYELRCITWYSLEI